MDCPKPAPFVIFLRNWAIVAFVFFVVDLLYYGWLNPGPVAYGTKLVGTIIFTLVMAAAYAHVYNKVSYIWKPGSLFSFNKKKAVSNVAGEECKATGSKIWNGILFSLLTSIVIIMAIELSQLMMSVIYVYVLDGIRGDAAGDAALAIKLALAGVALEVKGRTEDDPG
jgi:hypothetical protein